MPSVLFVCTANRFRSPLAAGIFRKALMEEESRGNSPWKNRKAEDWQVASGGTRTRAGLPVLPDVLAAAKQLGIDLSDHQSQPADDELLVQYDLILVMQESHKQFLLYEYPYLHERIYLLSRVVDHDCYDIPDAFNSPHGVMGVAVVLNELIRQNLRYICVLATALHNQPALD
jgi:protein-tyrosine-phosphatase